LPANEDGSPPERILLRRFYSGEQRLEIVWAFLPEFRIHKKDALSLMNLMTISPSVVIKKLNVFLNQVSGIPHTIYYSPFTVSRVWDISSGIGPCLSLAGGLCKLYANGRGKLPI